MQYYSRIKQFALQLVWSEFYSTCKLESELIDQLTQANKTSPQNKNKNTPLALNSYEELPTNFVFLEVDDFNVQTPIPQFEKDYGLLFMSTGKSAAPQKQQEAAAKEITEKLLEEQ